MLRKTGQRWEFESELALENFVWANLKSLLGLTALKRQYICKGEVSDILAVDENNQLFIIELKNFEDRRIVQQLTRYYDTLVVEKPFQPQVSYDSPIHLAAIAPSFHKNNFVDRNYSKLKFQFLSFEVIQTEQKFHLYCKDVDTLEAISIEIPYREIDSTDLAHDVLAPPNVLLETLGGYTISEQQIILGLRHKLLSFDQRMQETVTTKSILYGRGKRNSCAELYFDRKQANLALFLWLPLSPFRNREAIGRYRIWTDWQKVLYMTRVIEGLGKAKTKEEWEQIPKSARPSRYSDWSIASTKNLRPWSIGSSMAISFGCKDDSCSLESFVGLALQKLFKHDHRD